MSEYKHSCAHRGQGERMTRINSRADERTECRNGVRERRARQEKSVEEKEKSYNNIASLLQCIEAMSPTALVR